MGGLCVGFTIVEHVVRPWYKITEMAIERGKRTQRNARACLRCCEGHSAAVLGAHARSGKPEWYLWQKTNGYRARHSWVIPMMSLATLKTGRVRACRSNAGGLQFCHPLQFPLVYTIRGLRRRTKNLGLYLGSAETTSRSLVLKVQK